MGIITVSFGCYKLMQFFISILLTLKFITLPPDSDVVMDSSFDLRQDVISVPNFKTKEKISNQKSLEKINPCTLTELRFIKILLTIHVCIVCIFLINARLFPTP